MSNDGRAPAARRVPARRYLEANPARFSRGCERCSRYVEVGDGARLALDVHLPRLRDYGLPPT